MAPGDDEYIDALRAFAGSEQGAVLADLRPLLRGSLARSFGRQFSDADLDDLTQDSLLRIQSRIDTFERASRFTTWATAIAVHGALSELRRRRYRHVQLDDAAAAGDAALAVPPLASSDGDVAPRVGRLRQGIADVLTPRQREATLARLGGLPLMEIARRLDTSQGAVYKILHDARRRLKSYLEAGEDMFEGTAVVATESP